MKNKKIKIPLLALCSTVMVMVGVFLLGTSNIARAYTCASGYEYHESDGQCWEVNYHQDNNITATKPVVTNGVLGCANGSQTVTVGSSSQCSVQSQCGSDVYHSDTNSCWAVTKNDDGSTYYTSEDTNKIPPTNNDGTALTAANSSCTGGFDFISNGSAGAGCYKKAPDGSYPCGKDQDVEINASKYTTSTDCGDTGNSHLVPVNKAQSADTTKVPTAATSSTTTTCSDGSTAAAGTSCPPGTTPTNTQTLTSPPPKEKFGTCGNYGDNKQVSTVLIGCSASACPTNSGSTNFTGVPVITCILKFGVTALTVLVGVAAVAGIAWESVQYARAQDNQSIVSAARSRMRDIVIGLVVYVFFIALLSWLIPGGVLAQ